MMAGAIAAMLLATSCGKPVEVGGEGATTSSTGAGASSTEQVESQPSSTPASETSSTESSSSAEPSTVTEVESASTEPESTSAGESEMVPTHVYYLIDTRNEVRLVRELRDVPVGAGGIVAAIDAMLTGAVDPDYFTAWDPATTVLGVSVDDDVITVDLSGEARTANIGSAGAAMMIHQLVWTATEAADAPDASVVLSIEGESAGELWGAVTWDAPVAREQAESIRMLVQLDTPREGDELTSPVTIAGDAAAFEANVPWRLLAADGTEITSGFTMTSDGMAFSPFSFTLDLDPGQYTVEILQDDPSDGEAGPPSTDTRTFTVVPS